MFACMENRNIGSKERRFEINPAPYWQDFRITADETDLVHFWYKLIDCYLFSGFDSLYVISLNRVISFICHFGWLNSRIH